MLQHSNRQCLGLFRLLSFRCSNHAAIKRNNANNNICLAAAVRVLHAQHIHFIFIIFIVRSLLVSNAIIIFWILPSSFTHFHLTASHPLFAVHVAAAIRVTRFLARSTFASLLSPLNHKVVAVAIRFERLLHVFCIAHTNIDTYRLTLKLGHTRLLFNFASSKIVQKFETIY